jgi:hypothetical protein
MLTAADIAAARWMRRHSVNFRCSPGLYVKLGHVEPLLPVRAHERDYARDYKIEAHGVKSGGAKPAKFRGARRRNQ